MNAESTSENAEVVRACAVARQIEEFDLLIEDMEAELGADWGGLTFENAPGILTSDLARDLEFIAVAVDTQDEQDLAPVANVIRIAKEQNINVILVPHDLNTVALHQLMRTGADDFAPYPLPEGALHDAIERIKAVPEPVIAPAVATAAPAGELAQNRHGIVLPVYGLAGGVGASTFAANLAWEMQEVLAKENKKVCILDFDFQYGAISTYLDVPRTEQTFEFLSDALSADAEGLKQAMVPYRESLDILPAPPDALPLEFIGSEEVNHLIELATTLYDFVIIDLPIALVSWSETVLEHAHLYFGLVELDMRSAQNTLRFMRTLKAEDLPFEKVQFVLNRAPKFTDMNGKARVKKMAESLEIQFRFQLPEGGKQVANSGDEGEALKQLAPKNPLRKEILKIAKTISKLAADEGE
ncbi:MAG: AAA family ATPase [Rhodobacteraceae bacterium]|nr:AAA family ATPase [Paracoccaceae bacterium]